MSKTVRSFSAEPEVSDLIKQANLKKGKISNWVNDKIKKGVIYDNIDAPKIALTQDVKNLRVKI